nr:hypothetical protein [Polymorphobacter sp.]
MIIIPIIVLAVVLLVLVSRPRRTPTGDGHVAPYVNADGNSELERRRSGDTASQPADLNPGGGDFGGGGSSGSWSDAGDAGDGGSNGGGDGGGD